MLQRTMANVLAKTDDHARVYFDNTSNEHITQPGEHIHCSSLDLLVQNGVQEYTTQTSSFF